MATPSPQRMVTPSLELVRELTKGTMGSIWIARHLTLDTQFAVKFISPGLIEADPTALIRFTTEARAAASIKSPHVVSTTDYGVTDDGEPYIVMELLEGETLHERILREGPQDPPTVALIVAQVCRGLTAAHDLGILHRDIKPENIFLCSGNESELVKLIDFGLAKLTLGDTSLMPTAAGASVGTPAFMSPEQIDAEDTIDHRADLWGVAVVAYHALCGKHPFRGENVAEFHDAVMSQRFTPITEYQPDLPDAIDVWFERGLQPDPAARFESAEELAETLIDALEVEDEIPPFPSARPSLSGFRPLSSMRSSPPEPERISLHEQRLSVAELALAKEKRRTQFLAAVCVVLFAIAVYLASR
jgi:serine/threonine-protein kinase